VGVASFQGDSQCLQLYNTNIAERAVEGDIQSNRIRKPPSCLFFVENTDIYAEFRVSLFLLKLDQHWLAIRRSVKFGILKLS